MKVKWYNWKTQFAELQFLHINISNKNLINQQIDFYLKMNVKLLLKYSCVNFNKMKHCNHTLVSFNKM